MPFEWLIGRRYLASTRRPRRPSAITSISITAVSVGVAALIFVLAILNGFEGDLRTKILGTKAHLLITGESGRELTGFESAAEIVYGAPGVEGASPFIESDVMIASATNYSGVVLRGIEPDRAASASEIVSYMVEGDLAWLEDPDAALMDSRDFDAYERDLDMQEIEQSAARLRARLEAESAELEDARARMEAVIAAQLGEGSGADSDGTGSGDTAADRVEPPARRPGPPSLAELEASRTPGPPSLEERDAAREAAGGVGPPALPEMPGSGPIPREAMPGILIGTELRDTLRVGVGDQIQVINPDGDVGPTGPIPRAWQYRVVGVFHTGLYEYDNTMVYVMMPSARRFLNVDPDTVTGIEVRLHGMDDAQRVADALTARFAAAGRGEIKVATWMSLNERLFSALKLEQRVVGLLLMIIVLVASFAIVCVLIMIVIQRSDEIAIMRSMGASGRDIQRVFFVQGMGIGIAGTLIGLAKGLGLVAYLVYVGYPLDPNVYYIDRVPVELSWVEVAVIATGALAISAVATLFPSLQAARLDPAAALRHD